MNIEHWAFIPGFEGFYMVSDLGKIKSVKRIVYFKNGHYQSVPEKILKQHKNKRGYYSVMLSKDGVERRFYIHRLVWETFKSEIPDGYEINHLDENKNNNALSNLSLVTHKENENWGTKRYRQAITQSKTVYQYDLNNNFIREWLSGTEIERQLGFAQRNISACCRGKRLKTAYGYIWRYEKKEAS